MNCPYCSKPMTQVVRGWHCPGCHATVGQAKIGPVRR